MIKIKLLAASALAAGLLFGSQSAQAHCDSIEGPVAKAALAALDSGNVNLTSIGTADWAEWPNYVHKASGGGQISNYGLIGSGAVQLRERKSPGFFSSESCPT